MFLRRPVVHCFVALALLTWGKSGAAISQDWALKTIGGKTIPLALTRIDEAGNLFAGDAKAAETLSDLRELRPAKSGPASTAPPAMGPQSGVLLELAGGGQFAASAVEMKGEALALTLPGEGGTEVRIPLEAIAAIRFAPAEKQPAFEDALAHPSADNDQILARAEGQLQPLKGLLSKVTSDSVVFEFEGEARTLEKSKVFGIVLAKTSATAPRFHRLLLTDGSTLPAKSLQFADGAFRVPVEDFMSTIPAALVHQVMLKSDRLIFLSDLEPTAVQEKPLLMLPKPWQRDRSIRGGAIKLGGVEYSKGIGCQPRSQLTFKLPSGAQSFLAVAGLDASTKGKGACIFQVLGDGRSLYQQALTGKDPPAEIAVSVEGVEELTLLVDAGDDLDLSDHADWADARVLLKAN